MPQKIAVFLIFVMVILGIYLNRMYARIYEFNGVDLSKVVINRDYLLNNGQGQFNLKYVALGDSLTYGVGVDDYQSTYVYYIANDLQKITKSVEVKNLGIPGAKIADLKRYQLYQALTLKPDLVTILIGINDVHNVTSTDHFQKDLKDVISQLKKNGSQIVIINIPYLGSKKLIQFPFDLYFQYRITNFNQQIKQVAAVENVKYVEFNQLLRDKPIVEQSYYSQDGFHPNAQGYKIWGEILSSIITRMETDHLLKSLSSN